MKQAKIISASGRHRFPLLAAVLAACLCPPCGGALSAEAPVLGVPYDVHVPLLFKLISKSRTLSGRLGDKVVVAVSGPRSLTQLRELAGGKYLLGRPIVIVPFDTRATAIDVFYVGPDTDVSIKQISKQAQRLGAITITAIPEFVTRGVALGVRLSPSHKPKLIINLQAMRRQGVDLPSGILNIAEVLGR